MQKNWLKKIKMPLPPPKKKKIHMSPSWMDYK